MTVDSQPDSYFKMLSCSLDAQDGIQWLIWEGAKMIPGAGQAFDGIQTGAGILCKLTDGDYENAFYDFFNFTGGKALDRLGDTLKANPGKYSRKVHASYEQARIAYDRLMEKKNRDERDRLIRKSLEKYGVVSPAQKPEDDVEPGQPPPGPPQAGGGSTAAAPPAVAPGSPAPAPAVPADAGSPKSGPDFGKDLKNIKEGMKQSVQDLQKGVQDAGKDFREFGNSLKNLFKK
jgi:hypothetical protein